MTSIRDRVARFVHRYLTPVRFAFVAGLIMGFFLRGLIDFLIWVWGN